MLPASREYRPSAGLDAVVALKAGHASQAQMNDEVRRLTGLTLVRFVKDAMLTAP
jgi:hypothetical protein